ncbi:MAG: carboxypeptidase regulatory-like domain-containing protein [Planctomycetaceae bacterium]|nr:carboxypeptidase regulatory-like domain-containing protein [Planctomycetaceae bacterium]
MNLVTRTTICLALAASFNLSTTAISFADGPQVRPATNPVVRSNTTTGKTSAAKPPKITITDVALTDDGRVTGRVLTTNGAPIDGTRVVVRQGEQIFAKMVTNKEGQFTSEGMRAGVYTIATVQGGGLYRLWPKNIAPPSSKTQALLVTNEPVVRAQFGGSGLADWTAIGLGVAGLTVGIITLDKVDDIDTNVTTVMSSTAATTAVSP